MPPITQALVTVGLAIYVALLAALVVYQRADWSLLLYIAALATSAGVTLLLGIGQTAAFHGLLAASLITVAALFLHVTSLVPRPSSLGLRTAVLATGALLAVSTPVFVTDISIRPDLISFHFTPLALAPFVYAGSVAAYCVWVLEHTARLATDSHQVLNFRALAMGIVALMTGILLDISYWQGTMLFLTLALLVNGLLLGYAQTHQRLWRSDRPVGWLANALIALGLTAVFLSMSWVAQRQVELYGFDLAPLLIPWAAFTLLLAFSPRLRTAVLLAIDRLLLPSRDIESRLAHFERAEHDRAVHSALLAGVASGLVGDKDLQSMLEHAVAASQQALGYDRVTVLLLPPGTHVAEAGAQLEVVACAGTGADAESNAQHHLPVGVGLIGLAAASGQSVLSNDVRDDPRFIARPGAESTRAELCVPLRLEGEVIGVLDAESAQLGSLDANDARTLAILADQLAAAIGKAHLWDRLRSRAEELERLKDFNESIIQGVREGIVVADVDGRITFANRRFERMLAYTPGELLGRRWTSLLPPSWRSRLQLEGTTADRYETHLVGADGRELAVLVSSQMHWKDGRYRDTLLVFTDITERERSEEVARVLGEAALGLQAATTRENIFKTLTTQAKRSNVHVIISLLDSARRNLRVAFTSLPPRELRVVERALGTELVGLEVPIELVPTLADPVRQGRPTFSADGSTTVAPVLPPRASHLAAGIARRLGLGPVVHLALTVGAEPIGIVTVSHAKLTPDDEQSLTLFANQLATALEKARLQAETEQRTQRLAVLAETAHQLTVTADIHALGELITNRVSQVYRCDAAALYIRRESREELELVAAHGYTEDERQEAESTAWSRHPGWVARHRQPLLCSDAAHDPRVVYLGRGPRHNSLMSVPLLVAGNRCVGALEVGSRQAYTFQAADLQLLSTLANQVAIAIANALLVAEAESRADQLEAVSLTGQHIAADLNLDELLTHSAAETARLFNVPSASVYLVGDDGAVETASHYPPGVETYPAGTVGLGWLTEHQRPLAIPDLRDANVLPDVCLRLIERGVHSVLIVPVVHKEKVTGGILLFASEGQRAFDRESQELARIVAGQLAVAVDNARLYEATAEAKRRTEALVRLSFAGIITLDAEGRVRQINPAAAEMLGAPPEQLVGQELDTVLGIRLWDEVGGPLAEVGHTGRETDPMERSLPAHDGQRERDVLIGLARLPDGYLISMADITQLKELDRLKTELVANVSHELRSPLTAIKAYAELLLEGLDQQDDALRRQFLTVIDAEADRLSQCIGNLLDLARIEAEGYQLRPERFRLRSLIEDTVEAVAVRAATRSIHIQIEGPAEETWLVADRHILFSMLKNLVDNAAKFGPENSRVIVRSSRGSDGLFISVQDSGPGIATEQLPHIFEKFYRVQSATHSGIEGSGLGLVIARQAAQAHGGDISVRSEVGQGSTFTVRLPASLIDDSIGRGHTARTAA